MLAIVPYAQELHLGVFTSSYNSMMKNNIEAGSIRFNLNDYIRSYPAIDQPKYISSETSVQLSDELLCPASMCWRLGQSYPRTSGALSS